MFVLESVQYQAYSRNNNMFRIQTKALNIYHMPYSHSNPQPEYPDYVTSLGGFYLKRLNCEKIRIVLLVFEQILLPQLCKESDAGTVWFLFDNILLERRRSPSINDAFCGLVNYCIVILFLLHIHSNSQTKSKKKIYAILMLLYTNVNPS